MRKQQSHKTFWTQLGTHWVMTDKVKEAKQHRSRRDARRAEDRISHWQDNTFVRLEVRPARVIKQRPTKATERKQ